MQRRISFLVGSARCADQDAAARRPYHAISFWNWRAFQAINKMCSA
jgi:hypothetical protein